MFNYKIIAAEIGHNLSKYLDVFLYHDKTRTRSYKFLLLEKLSRGLETNRGSESLFLHK